MTPHDELDLQLRGWMRTRAAQAASPRPDLVDGAMARTATVRQRRRGLVRTGEPGVLTLPVPNVGGRAVLLLGVALAMLAILGGALLAGALLPRERVQSLGRIFYGGEEGLFVTDAPRTPGRQLLAGRRVLQVRASPSGRYVAIRYVPTVGAGPGGALAAIVDDAGRPTGPQGLAGSLAAIPPLDASGVPMAVGDLAWAPVAVDGHELLAMTTFVGVLVVDEAGSIVLDERVAPDRGATRAGVAWSRPDGSGGLRLAWGSGSTIYVTSFMRDGPPTTRRLVDLRPLDEAARPNASPHGRDLARLVITPDGSRIAAVISGCGSACWAGLWEVSDDGSARLLDGKARTDTWLSLDPDGRSVLAGLWGETDGDAAAVHHVPLDGEGRGARAPGIVAWPPAQDLPRTRWSTDGSLLIVGTSSQAVDSWSDTDPASLDLWAMRPDGGGAVQLATMALDVDLAPRP